MLPMVLGDHAHLFWVCDILKDKCLPFRFVASDFLSNDVLTGFPRLLESPGFFLEYSRTWKVLENHFGPGKSSKLKLKVLESCGKISLKLLNCFYNYCMYIETICK